MEVVATSIISYAEARAAFARKFLEKGICEQNYAVAKRDRDEDWEHMLVLSLTSEMAKLAGDLAEEHRLRGFDALHTTAIELKKAVPVVVSFSSADEQLRDAARKEGFQ